MKTLLCCALTLVGVAVPAMAEAAVTYSFTATPSFGLYTRRHVSGSADSFVYGDTADAVSGRFTVDTAAAGPNGDAAPAISYDGSGGPFLTATFANMSGGLSPAVTSSGVATHYVAADGQDYAILSYSMEDLDDATGRFTRTTYELSGFGVPTTLFDGLLLPDFTGATGGLTFSITTQVGTNDDYLESFAGGEVAASDVTTDVSGAVPEPATWAAMTLGFGLVGGALRRRRPAAIAA